MFDNRNFGASDGEPRQEIDPWQQIEDYRDAISYALTLAETDRERIGVWGSSYSGAHVLVLGATDRRIKCVASQVPLISGYRNARRLIRADMIAPVLAMCAEDRLKRYQGGAPADLPVVSEDPAGPAALPTPDSAGTGSPRPADTRAVLAQRGHPALDRAVHGLRARRVHRADQPHAACSWWWRSAIT